MICNRIFEDSWVLLEGLDDELEGAIKIISIRGWNF